MTAAPGQLWSRFWFSAGSPQNLAAARIIVAAHSLWVLLSRDPSGVSGLPQAFWSSFPVTARWRYLAFPGHPTVEFMLELLAIAMLAAVLIGMHVRITGLISALLLYHLSAFDAILWYPLSPAQRGFETAIIALVALAFSPCDHVWTPHAPTTRSIPEGEGWRYRWPLTLLQVFVAQIYLFAGWSKIAAVGLQWASGQNIRAAILSMNQWPGVGGIDSFGPLLAEMPYIPGAVGVGTIIFELGFPIVLFWPVSRRVVIPTALTLHAGIAASMHLFFPSVTLLLVFVNWQWLCARLRTRLHRQPGTSPDRSRHARPL